MSSKTKNYTIKEIYGSTELENHYKKSTDQNELVRLPTKTHKINIRSFITNFFREVFLPQGYPHSVSEDYFKYQFYDTIQAFCSRITGTLTTKIILKSVGVGDAEATPLAAATTWIFKDGTGMFGSILFAWWKGTHFDYDCKKWRLFADILNDFAMFVEMLLPHFPTYTMFLLCATTTMKAGVGVSGSATRAAITQHQAKKQNMADVSAKDGSQETAVNLLASFLAIMILNTFSHERFDWLLFVIFTILHLLSNYLAVKSLKFDSLNNLRYNIALEDYILHGKFSNPKTVNRKEPVILGFGLNDKKLCGFKINMGQSLQTILPLISDLNVTFEQYVAIYESNEYIIVPNIAKSTIEVVIYKNETSKTVIIAYFHACVLGLALGYLKKPNKTNYSYLEGIIIKIVQKIEKIPKNKRIFDLNVEIQKFIGEEPFLENLQNAGWHVDKHSIKTDEWRLKNFK